MPKTAIDEDDDALLSKDEVGLSIQALIAPPSLKPIRAKNRN
jgi:hypothetical protein